ncbi:OHCU decarboxylase-domain-containing protein [Microdochium trichocladiopsis]|uniref:OHCU decarboxylase-domain-containing protein n=1 Tax=Microdochium trichocladiopsis TaxID=1682393 RepID=A0A9P9BXG2_9PEZI|nr:OHCU decarboxylase-domain-containing protein [Microdochium trichocladiopsis]KAH7041580.1 OHCU decarboxylase-domain-containing protein [Microdochium trichocladiopsis]
MADISLPPISSLPTAPDETIIAMLDLLFEPSPEIHRLAIPAVRGQQQQQQQQQPPSRVPANPGLTAEMGNTSTPFSQSSTTTGPYSASSSGGGKTPFKATTIPSPAVGTVTSQAQPSGAGYYSSYPELIRSIGSLMLELVDISAAQSDIDESSSSAAAAATTFTATDNSREPGPRAKLHSILGSHPRLGAKKVDSALSRAEQAQLQQAPPPSSSSSSSSSPQQDGKETEAQALARLNALYESTFPGLRYVVFVNGRGRDVIMQDMQRRIARGDIRAEERAGVEAMIDIALDRAGKILA